MATIRVTGVQMRVSSKLNENLARILEHIRQARADFLLFPEMSLTGYHGRFSDKAARLARRQIKAACRQSYVTALIGTGCKEEDGTYIQTRIVSEEGTLVGTQEKLVPTKKDRTFCRPGEELRTFHHRGVTFGCLMGNDLWVVPGAGPYPDPRLSYHLGQKGAQIIFHSNHSGSDAAFEAYYDANLTLRARESKVYIVTVNTADPKGPVNAPSGVVSPRGKWLVACPREGEQTFSCDLELDAD